MKRFLFTERGVLIYAVIVPDNLPAKNIVRGKYFVMDEMRAIHQI